MSFIEEFDRYCGTFGKPDRIELLLCDINAVLRGKWLPGDQVDKLVDGKLRLPLSTYAPNIMGLEVEASGLGIVAGDPDGVVVAVPGTLKPVPWGEGNVAQVMIELEELEGGISFLSPRQQLAKVLARFDAQGWKPVTAAELEFYIVQRRDDPDDAPSPPTGSPPAQNYDMELLQRSNGVLNDILDACKAQGLATDTLVAEYGPGQFEVNFHHSDNALVAADTAIMFRRIVRSTVADHGLEATFMAKPYRDAPGNGMHLHCSVVDTAGNNIFTPQAESQQASPMLKKAVAGALTTMRDMQAIFAPHLNSLRRFGPNSFAPTAAEWGYDHRGAAVRIPEINGDAARLEHRIGGADVNPYLAITAILGGILFGIENGPELPRPLDANASSQSTPLTADWSQTMKQFEESEFARSLFGDAYHHVYTQVKRDEIAELSTLISAAEYRHYLSRL